MPLHRHRLLALLIAAGALAPSTADAQGLLGRARRAAERAATQAVDRAVDAAGRSPEQAAPGEAGAPASGSAGVLSLPSGPALFATDFSGDAIGAFPAGFALGRGTFEVVELRGRRALKATSHGEIHVELPTDLPEAFTLELEVASAEGWTQEVHFKSSPRAYVRYSPDNGGVGGQPSARANAASSAGTGRLYTVRVEVDGPAVKVYHGPTLVANVPEADLGRSNRITFKTSGSQDRPAYIASVRLTAGAGSGPTPVTNPNYPGQGPTTGGPAPSPAPGGGASAGQSRFEAHAVGAVDAAMAGTATYERGGAQHTVTLTPSGVQGQQITLLVPGEGLQTQTPYAVETGGPIRTGRASATAWVRVGEATEVFEGTHGHVTFSGAGGGRAEGLFDFTGRTSAGVETRFRGSFDARQPLTAPGPMPSPVGSVTTATVTTSLADVQAAAASGPAPGTPRRSTYELQRTPNGGYVLQPGYYGYDAQSYSLSVGGAPTTESEGHAPAPLAGLAADAVATVLRNSVQHPEIGQPEVQRLVWGVILGLQFEDLSAGLQAVAARLLTPRQLAALGRCLDGTSACVPAPNETERRVRALLVDPSATFQQVELAAIRPYHTVGVGSRPVAPGQWFAHPDGYAVRYLPQTYGRTTVEVYVPQGSPAVGRELDPAAHVAVSGNTAGQRLALSARGTR